MDDLSGFDMKKFSSFYHRYKDISLLDLESLILNNLDNYNKRLLIPKFKSSMHLKEIQTSNSIEGNTCTLIDTKLIVEDNSIIDNKTLTEILETLNLNFCIKKYRRIQDVTFDLISAVNERLLYNISESAGKYRTCSVYLTGSEYIPPRAELVLGMLRESLNDFIESSRGLRAIFKLKYDIVHIHPFEDGNGRTSRVILNGLLENEGFPRIIINKEMVKYYYKSLESASCEGKVDEWYRFCYIALLYNTLYDI